MTDRIYIYSVYDAATEKNIKNFETEKEAIEYAAKCTVPAKVRVLQLIRNGNKGVQYERVEFPNRILEACKRLKAK